MVKPTLQEVKAIFDCWNAQKEFGRWKSHRKITPDIKQAVIENLRNGWDTEDMCCAIVNFASCYHSKETKWTYGKWSLAQFLSRGKSDKEKGRQWIRFTDNNYREDDWLTRDAVHKRIDSQRRKPATLDLAKGLLKKVPGRDKRKIWRELQELNKK